MNRARVDLGAHRDRDRVDVIAKRGEEATGDERTDKGHQYRGHDYRPRRAVTTTIRRNVVASTAQTGHGGLKSRSHQSSPKAQERNPDTTGHTGRESGNLQG